MSFAVPSIQGGGRDNHTRPPVLLHSPPGAGKTSLIQAHLLPTLAQKGKFHILPIIRVSHPGLPDDLPEGVNRYVVSSLLHLAADLPSEKQTPLETLFTLDLDGYLKQRFSSSDKPVYLLLIFDQFEEILTLESGDEEVKRDFFEQVGAALRNQQYWALFAMREEYIAALEPYLWAIPTRFSTRFRLDRLGTLAACEALQQPARQLGINFTDAAAQMLVNDLRRVRVQRWDGTVEEQFDAHVDPVQLQVVAHRLWEKRQGSEAITEADVASLGSFDNALADYYADQVKDIAGRTGESEQTIRDWFDRQLITEQGLRGQVLMGEAKTVGLDNSVVRQLIDAYLVRAENRRGLTWFELAHDRWIGPIQKDNANWRKSNLNNLQRRAALWEKEGRPEGLLRHRRELIILQSRLDLK
jgi:hypothetical protein